MSSDPSIMSAETPGRLAEKPERLKWMTDEERLRNNCQRACFTSPACSPGAADACPNCQVADLFVQIQAQVEALTETLRILEQDSRQTFDRAEAAEAQVEALTAELSDARNALSEGAEGVLLRTGLGPSIRMWLTATAATREALRQRAEAAESKVEALTAERADLDRELMATAELAAEQGRMALRAESALQQEQRLRIVDPSSGGQ
jgi:hypothetical protein